MADLRRGLTGKAQTEVNAENTARAYGSGSVDVFATPAMVGLMEKAAINAVDHLLDEGQATVGVQLDVVHKAATPLGMKVYAEAELKDIDGRKLVFAISARDEEEVIGFGTHERFIIDLERFLKSAKGKAERVSRG